MQGGCVLCGELELAGRPVVCHLMMVAVALCLAWQDVLPPDLLGMTGHEHMLCPVLFVFLHGAPQLGTVVVLHLATAHWVQLDCNHRHGSSRGVPAGSDGSFTQHVQLCSSCSCACYCAGSQQHLAPACITPPLHYDHANACAVVLCNLF